MYDTRVFADQDCYAQTLAARTSVCKLLHRSRFSREELVDCGVYFVLEESSTFGDMLPHWYHVTSLSQNWFPLVF